MQTQPFTEDRLDAARSLVVAQTRRRVVAAGRQVPDDDWLAEAAARWLAPYLDAEKGFAHVAVDDDGVAAVLGGLPTRLAPQDSSYTYMPPRHVLCPLSGWAARDDASAAVGLPMLLDAARERASAEGLDRVNVQVLDADWFGGSVWRSAGLRSDTTMAFRPLAAPVRPGGAVTVRPAREEDLPALVELGLEEARYHARHTGSGNRDDVPAETVRGNLEKIVGIAPDAPPDVERGFVAVDDDGTVVGVTSVHVLTAVAGNLGSLVLPERYAYIGLTDVAEHARGTGVGGALLRHAVAWCRALPDPPPVVGLHYVTDNVLSAPFWSGHGFTPALTLLTTAPRHRAGGVPT